MKRLFTSTDGANKVAHLSRMAFMFLSLLVVSGFANRAMAVSEHDTVGSANSVFGFNLTGYHVVYVGLTGTDYDENSTIDGLFYLAEDTIIDYGYFSAGVLFKDGVIKARNGDNDYANDASISYNLGQKYHCWIETAVYDKTYSVYIQTEGMDKPEIIASEYSYRLEKVPNITQLGVWGSVHNSDGDKSPLEISNLAIVSGVGVIPVIDSTDATLKSIAVSKGQLSPAFSPDVTEYTVLAPYGTTSVNVSASSNATSSSVAGAGAVDVSSGSGTATIVVTSLDKTEETYTVSITVDPTASGDATLSELSVSLGTLNPVFDPGTMNYTVVAPLGTTTVTVTAKANHSTATVTGDGAVDVSSGSETSTVEVKAQDGSIKTYTVKISVGGVGVFLLSEKDIQITPNPAYNEFKIATEGLFNYEIFDVSGALINSGTANDNLFIGSELVSGSYFLKINQNNKSGMFKLIKL